MSLSRFALALGGALAALALAASPASAGRIKHVFVIAMENQDAATIYAGGARTRFLGRLMAIGAIATDFVDELPDLPSEPHYLVMEAGTHEFHDQTFATDGDPTAGNSTDSPAHLTTQLEARGLSWKAYQEDVSGQDCPIASHGHYVAKHNPFVFFRDVSGGPSADARRCIAHIRPYAELAGDLASGRAPSYVFITPNLCHDMHDGFGCFASDPVAAGDDWLSREAPALIAYARRHDGVVFITWDQGDVPFWGSGGRKVVAPFLAVGAGVRAGARVDAAYDHRSLVKSVEEIFGLPILPTVKGAADLAGLFVNGAFP